MAVYASFGAASALFMFLLSFSFACVFAILSLMSLLIFSFSILSLAASLSLFRTALTAVLRSPTSFFDTTPMGMLNFNLLDQFCSSFSSYVCKGRILSRLSKDQDTLDNELSMTLLQFLNTFSSILGTIALVFYTFPYLGILFGPMAVMYYVVASYYRKSSVETKRLDSLMRSGLYASYSGMWPNL